MAIGADARAVTVVGGLDDRWRAMARDHARVSLIELMAALRAEARPVVPAVSS